MRREAGFTLVEMLVSLALLSIAAVLATAGFASDRHALARLERRTAAAEEVAAAQDVLRGDLERVFPYGRYETGEARIDFTGSAERLAFLTSAPRPGRPNAIARELLAATPEGELVLEGEDGARPRRLLSGVTGLDISYWGEPPREPAEWRSDWADREVPPALVRVRLAFARGDRRLWPELIVRLGAEVDAGCMPDLQTGACRGRG